MTKPKHKYRYCGPVFQFDQYIGVWEAITWAVSSTQALNNMTYQYKRLNHFSPSANIKLIAGGVELVEDAKDGTETRYRQLTFDDLWG